MHTTKAYSLDLRKRVVQAVKSGLNKKKVVKQFQVSMSTVNRWCRLDKTDQLAPKTNWRKGHSQIIKDYEALAKFVDENNHLTHKQMAEKWGNISATRIGVHIRRIGYTKKKDHFYIKNAMRKNAKTIEQK